MKITPMKIALNRAGMRFGSRWIFRGLDLAVEHGATLAILGPNGRGKTTALHAILGFLPLTEGERTAPNRLGYVPQLLTIPAPHALREMVVMGRCARVGLFGQPSPEDYRAADAAIERVGIRHLAGEPFARLSGGERQMGLIARALATGSDVLVLDEPASALDLGNQGRLLYLLNDLRQAREMTILFTTHDPNHALAAADDALLMMKNEAALSGPVDTIMSEANLTRLYGVAMRQFAIPDQQGQAMPVIVPMHARHSGEKR
ncbi:MAG: iron complex transport system ATP-binding [Beijerinckiaceae bacterium]|nr:MAG: iron complex transport system ATP-binding [Beijerinckiaceae bacterium]